MWLAVLGATLLVIAAAGGTGFALTRGGGGSDGGVCKEQTFPSQGQKHVPPAKLPKGFKYNSFPPTTGPHDPQPLIFGEYTEPVPQDRLVHNQEHGGIGIQYGPDVPKDVVERLTAWYRTDARGLVLAPLSPKGQGARLRDKIALTAWTAERENPDDPQSNIVKQEGHLAICSTFDEDEFTSFRDRYRAKGPELFSLDQLQPGQ